MMKDEDSNNDKMIYNLINNYKTTNSNKVTKRKRVNASLITETPEIPKQAYPTASGNWD